eukprot:COSAG03_NODE_3060_length_2255_cov_1.567254_1_plen_79_part_10
MARSSLAHLPRRRSRASGAVYRVVAPGRAALCHGTAPSLIIRNPSLSIHIVQRCRHERSTVVSIRAAAHSAWRAGVCFG